MSTSPSKGGKREGTGGGSVHQKLSLLTGGSSGSKPFIKSKSQTTSSLAFPSFRFSPESEEIQEIISEEEIERRASFSGGDRPITPPASCSGAGAAGGGSTSSGDASSTPPQKSGGDISPLKEYILKHKWANKWDKRSLSLDLDLKGKIITAIEDKRRSFVSHFYNEEDETPDMASSPGGAGAAASAGSMITSSCSIPEQLVVASGSDGAEEDISVHSDSVVHRKRYTKYNFQEETNTDYFDDFELSSPEEGCSLPNTPITNILPDDLKDLVVEEIGVDCCEDTSMVGIDGKTNLSLLREFVLPEGVQEKFMGAATLYNPPLVVKGARKFPIQQEPVLEELEGEQVAPVEVEVTSGNIVTSPSFSSVVSRVVQEIGYHPWVKYWMLFLSLVVLFNLGYFLDRCIWFGLGVTGVIVVNQALWKEEEAQKLEPHSSKNSLEAAAAAAAINPGLETTPRENQKCQGWMLTLPSAEYPPYDPFSFHLRNTKSVFIRLDSSNLLISHPHSKHRIPKRRLWNDATLSNDIIFVRHNHYSLKGARVEIVPFGLAKKRVWCKKYPIAITLACPYRHVGKLLETTQDDNNSRKSPDPDGSVSFSKDDKGFESVCVGRGELRGELYKEETCQGKTLYIFARTDREKDDWFRRLVNASKLEGEEETTSKSTATPTDSFNTFVQYMKRACPLIQLPAVAATPLNSQKSPRSQTPTNEQLELLINSNNSTPSSPSISRKSSPEKEQPLLPPTSELQTPYFLNAILARLFYDFLRSPKWTANVRQMIDRKLFFLRKPKVVESLKVKALDLGSSLPIINHASSPVLDSQGLWIDLDVSFTGNVIITIEAFVNLLNMGKGPPPGEGEGNSKEAKAEIPSRPPRSPTGCSHTHAMFDSDADDSGESSESEEELDLELDLKEKEQLDNRAKMLKYADAIAKSSVMRNKHVQKVVGNIAATPFMLTVEIKQIQGVMAVNVPPVPNDRVWIGFRSNPVIDINARAQVGERVVSLSQVTGWIKKKLLLEFQRVMVCPNMMDVTISLMEFELPK